MTNSMRKATAAEIAAYIERLPETKKKPKSVEITIVYENATEHHTIGESDGDDGR